MSVVQDVQKVLDEARAMVNSLTAEQLSAATPCEGWNVQALIEHMTGVVSGFASALGSAPQADGATDVKAVYGQAVDALSKGMHAPEALDGTLTLPFGEMPAERALNIALADQMIHTWDMAKATGRPYTMDERLAMGTLQGLTHMVTAELRGPGKPFGAEVPCAADAPVQDRLVSFAGRHP